MSAPRVVPEVASVLPLHKPKFVVAYGRGRSGKSTGLRYLAERAQIAGRDVTIADADPRATLVSHFSEVLQPKRRDDKALHAWLDAVVNAQADALTTVVLDRNGGDQAFGRFAASVNLTDLLTEVGIMPVALHFIGADTGDLADLKMAENGGGFIPEATALILNAGTITDDTPPDDAFEAVRAHSVYKAALKRGAREVLMPRHFCLSMINDLGLTLAEAETDKRLGLTNRQRAVMWRRAMEEALAPVAAWLP